MSTVYKLPGTYAEEVTKALEGPIKATPTGFGSMQAVTQKGPVGVPTRATSFAEWTRIFGGRELATRSDAAYEAELFFKEGGSELITIRMCHWTDIADFESYAAGIANSTASTDGVAATSASMITGAAPFAMDAGDTILLGVDIVPPATTTFDAARASVTGSGFAIVDLDGDTLIFEMNGGPEQQVDFTSEADLAAVLVTINTAMSGGYAVESTGEVQLSSDIEGTDSDVNITGGTALGELGLSVTQVAGTGDVANVKAITAVEFEARVEEDTTALVTVNANSTCTILSPTTGIASELDVTGGTGLAAVGLTVSTVNGTAAGATFTTLKLEAGYLSALAPGIDGNQLGRKITQAPKHPSAGAGLDIAADVTAGDTSIQLVSSSNITEKSVLKIWDGTNTEYKEVTEVRSVVTAGAVTFFADLAIAMTNSFTAVAGMVQTQEFDLAVYYKDQLVKTWTELSMLDTADNYVETIINDEVIGDLYVVATDLDAAAGLGADLPATDAAAVNLSGGTDETIGLVDTDWIGDQTAKTGMYGWDIIDEFMPIFSPGANSAAVVHSFAQYCQSRIWFEYLGYVTAGSTETQAINYRQNTLGIDSSYMSLYAGGVKVFDPEGSGSRPRRSISGLGGMAGIRARVDRMPAPNGGPWNAPAGEGDYGTVYSALDVADVYSDNEAGNMNEVGINVIRKPGKTAPVLVWGTRTLDNSVQKIFKYIPVRRFFQYAEKSIVDSTTWSVFRNNNFKLWDRLRGYVDDWLKGLMPLGAFPTDDKALAYFVKSGVTDGVMTAEDIDNGYVRSQVGLAPNKPGEFVVFQFSQFDSGWDVQEG